MVRLLLLDTSCQGVILRYLGYYFKSHVNYIWMKEINIFWICFSLKLIYTFDQNGSTSSNYEAHSDNEVSPGLFAFYTFLNFLENAVYCRKVVGIV